MSKLSEAIFTWDSEDYALLLKAKQQELVQQGLVNIQLVDVE
jgi:hypothetical protein